MYSLFFFTFWYCVFQEWRNNIIKLSSMLPYTAFFLSNLRLVKLLAATVQHTNCFLVSHCASSLILAQSTEKTMGTLLRVFRVEWLLWLPGCVLKHSERIWLPPLLKVIQTHHPSHFMDMVLKNGFLKIISDYITAVLIVLELVGFCWFKHCTFNFCLSCTFYFCVRMKSYNSFSLLSSHGLCPVILKVKEWKEILINVRYYSCSIEAGGSSLESRPFIFIK